MNKNIYQKITELKYKGYQIEIFRTIQDVYFYFKILKNKQIIYNANDLGYILLKDAISNAKKYIQNNCDLMIS